MYGTTSMGILEQRREELLREAEVNCLKKALPANHWRPVGSRRVSTTVAWQLARATSLLHKVLRTPKNAD